MTNENKKKLDDDKEGNTNNYQILDADSKKSGMNLLLSIRIQTSFNPGIFMFFTKTLVDKLSDAS